MKHYSVKHNMCIIDVSTFIYESAFNWSIYARTLDELYECIRGNIDMIITFKNFEKLFKITKMNYFGQTPDINYIISKKRNLIENIIDYTYNILISNSNYDTDILDNKWKLEEIQDLRNINVLTKEAVNKTGLAHTCLFSCIEDKLANEILYEIVDNRLIK